MTWAASLGDRSENADYQYNKKRLREIDRRVRYLTKCMENLKIVDYSPQQEGKVFFGSINYIGYLEANELLTGKTDVLVCDGFTGNVTLKTMEGVVRMFLSLLKSQGEGKKRSWWS